MRNGRLLRQALAAGGYSREEMLVLTSKIVDDAHTAARMLHQVGAPAGVTVRKD